ncbi:MAG: tyrosine-type recombinase/integrase [Halioglobus sp.]|nr:tyrosine-type recombinase/integrase [Halioglobus sp.]
MTNHDQNPIKNPSLECLVFEAQNQLKVLGYHRRSQSRYQAVWRRFIEFAHRQPPVDGYSDELAVRFMAASRPKEGVPLKPEEGWRQHSECCMKALRDYARFGRIERSVVDMQSLVVAPAMQKPLRDFEQFCKDRRHLRPSSLQERLREVTLFLVYLSSERQVRRLEAIQPEDLLAFVTSRRCFQPKTVSRIVSGVRQFLQFLTMRGILRQDLSASLPTVHVPRDAHIPSVWEPEHIARLLAVIDRSSAKGKRDYCILLLACRLGIRLGDIRELTLDQINWDEATLEITQSKTLAPLQLPLTEEVGSALIDYVTSGRPQTEYRHVFLQLRPPYAPFNQNSHLHYIVTYWRQLAGIRFRRPQRHGLHSLRHSLATQLLRKDTPVHVISDVLGHASSTSTMIYAKADVDALRDASLDVEEVSDVQ